MRWSDNWELLTWRLLDLLSMMGELMLEELFVNVNFQFQSSDKITEHIYVYRDQYRLADVVLRLCELREQGMVASRPSEYPAETGVAGLWFFLTDAGQERWTTAVRHLSPDQLYEVHSYGTMSTEDARPIDAED